MGVTAFVVLILIFGYASYLSVRLYYFSAVIIKKKVQGAMTSVILYSLVAVFMTLEFFVFLFPAWLASKLQVFATTQNTTMALLALGGGVIIATVWMGWRSNEGRQFAKLMRG